MSLVDGNGLSAADIAAVTGNNGNGFGFGGDGVWLILVLLLFAAFNGNNGWGGNGNGGGIPYMGMQQGFDQQSLMAGIGAVQAAQATAAVGQCNQTTTFLQSIADLSNQMCSNKFDTINALSNGHNTILQQMGNYEMARQQCCCENKQLILDLKYAMAQEAAATRAAVQAGTQTIADKLCQQEIDNLKAQNAQLQTQLNLAGLAASQTAQTADLKENNTWQTLFLRQILAPTPIPAYVVPAPGVTPAAAATSGT